MTAKIADYTLALPSGFVDKPRLASKVCVVTGATGGIGSATVLRLAEEGARGIVIVDLDQGKCDAFAKNLIARFGSSLSTFVAKAIDVTDEMLVADLFDATLKQFGHVDVVFANAGKGSPKALLAEETAKNMNDMFKVNTLGPWLTAKHAARVMLAPRDGAIPAGSSRFSAPSIIINSSVMALHGFSGYTAYAASKWASRGIGLAIAQELGPLGIRVNTIHPGGTTTPLFFETIDAALAESVRTTTALRRWADPIEIANAVVFLASDESSYVTGAALGVHGGLLP